MLIGNPDKFAILLHRVEEWNMDDTFKNGILHFCINGEMFPKEILSVTLACEVPWLREKMANVVVDKKIYYQPKDEAFAALYSKTFPEECSEDNDYRFQVNPECFLDFNYITFAVSNGVNVRILATQLQYKTEESRHDLSFLQVLETSISNEEWDRMVIELGKGEV